MGSFVTIGFVDLYNKKQFVKHCADILEKYKEHILDVSYKYPTDDDGYQWEEKTIPFPFIFKEAIEKCIQNELVEIKINWTFLPRTDFFPICMSNHCCKIVYVCIFLYPKKQ